MTIRTTVTVVLALALLAASLPAIQAARVSHADSKVAASVGRLGEAAAALAAENDAVDGRPAGTRLTLHLPTRSWGSSGLVRLRVPGPINETDVAWTVAGGRARTSRFESVDLVAPAGFELTAGGRQAVVLELTRTGDDRAIRVRRPRPGDSG